MEQTAFFSVLSEVRLGSNKLYIGGGCFIAPLGCEWEDLFENAYKAVHSASSWELGTTLITPLGNDPLLHDQL